MGKQVYIMSCGSRVQVWDQEGVFGFFKGMRPKIVQSVLGASIMFVLKERLHSTAMRLVNSSK